MSEENFRIRIRKGDIEIEIEGKKDFVEKHYQKLKEEILGIPIDIEKHVAKSKAKKEKEKDKQLLISLPEFYKEKNPKSHPDKTLVFAYWLTKKENIEEFQASDILECYDKARIRKPANIRDVLGQVSTATRALLLRSSQKGEYTLSLTGMTYVEEKLPK